MIIGFELMESHRHIVGDSGVALYQFSTDRLGTLQATCQHAPMHEFQDIMGHYAAGPVR